MESTDRKAEALEVVDHGVDGAQYFQGCGVSFTDYEDCATGAGSTPAEALEDALEVLAQGGWTLSDELEAEARAELGDEEHAERDYVSEEEARGEEDVLPPLEWSVSFHAWSGCSPLPERFETREEARAEVARILRARRAEEHPVSTLERGESWEVGEPEWVRVLVPDTCGTLALESNEEEREEERERMRDFYPSELYYYVSVRIR